MRISDVLSSKPGGQVVTIPPDNSVRDLLALLARHNIGAVVDYDVRMCIECGSDVTIIGIGRLALDRVHGNAPIGDERCGNIVLC